MSNTRNPGLKRATLLLPFSYKSVTVVFQDIRVVSVSATIDLVYSKDKFGRSDVLAQQQTTQLKPLKFSILLKFYPQRYVWLHVCPIA